MSHATVRATILPEIVKMISKEQNISEKEAMDMFYTSATGASFADDETGLYGQSPLFIFGLFREEMQEKGVWNQAQESIAVRDAFCHYGRKGDGNKK